MAKLGYESFIKWAILHEDAFTEKDWNAVCKLIELIQPLGLFGRLTTWPRVRFTAEALMEKYEKV